MDKGLKVCGLLCIPFLFHQVVDSPGNFVEPTIITHLSHDSPIVLTESFVPILYVVKFSDLDDVIHWNNETDQGLASSIYTQQIDKVFHYME